MSPPVFKNHIETLLNSWQQGFFSREGGGGTAWYSTKLLQYADLDLDHMHANMRYNYDLLNLHRFDVQ